MQEQSESQPLTKTENRTSLELKSNGGMSLVSLSDQLAFAQRLMTEKMISNTFETPQQVVIGIQYAKALGIEPIVGLKMMYVVGGKPSLYSEGPLALCQRQPCFGSIEEFFIDEEGQKICFENKNLKSKVWGSVTRVWRKDDPRAQEDYFTLEDLARAKLDVNKYGKKDVWAKFERIMMRYKARTMALKSKFADLIGGIPIAEYDDHFSPETPDVVIETSPSRGSALNDMFGKADQ